MTNSLVVYIRDLAPIGKPLLVAGDPLDSLLFEQAMILTRGLLDRPQVERSFMPGLAKNSHRQIPLGTRIYLTIPTYERT